MTEGEEAGTAARVLVNAEEQYCLWPAAKDVPAGWSVAFEGDRAACLAFVERTWTDMRPKSLREAMAGTAGEADNRGG